MKQLIDYLNPLKLLGKRKYSFAFPLFCALIFAVILEIYAYLIANDPNSIGIAAISVFIALIIYFAFRDGIVGGFVVTLVTVGYYFYIMYTRRFQGDQLIAGIETTLVLGGIYLLVAFTIGWLKQTIDGLIESEANEKRRLQTIIQQLPVGIIITDNQGRVTQVNHLLEKMIGAKIPIGYTIGTDTLIVPSKYQQKVAVPADSPLAYSLRIGKPVVSKEFELRKDGKNMYLNVSAAPIHNKKGTIIAAASIISDITLQKEMELRKDDFIHMASHELKSPITSLNLYMDLLVRRLSKVVDAKSQKTLDSIRYQIQRLQELVSDLLDVSRLQSGKLSFHREYFRLDHMVEETVEELRELAKDQHLHYRNNKGALVYADKFRISQVLTNLITNAIKYSPSNTSIEITVENKGGWGTVSVKDHGIGIAQKQHKKIFDRLYQVTESNEKTFPGLGLGLYISKEIVTRHKGKIWVESEKGRGSTFYFSLPIRSNKSLEPQKQSLLTKKK